MVWFRLPFKFLLNYIFRHSSNYIFVTLFFDNANMINTYVVHIINKCKSCMQIVYLLPICAAQILIKLM